MTESVTQALECAACRTASIPIQAVCPVCGFDDVREIGLGRDGVLYSHTTLYVGAGAPCAVGYVDIDGPTRHRAFARFRAGAMDRLSVGMRVTRDIDGLWYPSRAEV